MIIKKLKSEYIKSDNLQKDFINSLINLEENFSDQEYIIDSCEPFPIYFKRYDNTTRSIKMLEAFKIIQKSYINLEQDILMDHSFWISLYLVHYRDYLIDEYPSLKSSKNDFKQIILKKFDWENYIYKMVLITQYIVDNYEQSEYEKIIRIFSNNMDISNYCLKYSLFRNDKFIKLVFKVIELNDLSEILKKRLKQLEGYGKDERYGRRVLLEMNKRYPVSMIHIFDYHEFENTFLEILNELKEKQVSLKLLTST